jgi:hypothetical protein
MASALTKPVITERHEAHDIAEPQEAGERSAGGLQDRGGEQILQAVLLDQRHHEHGGGGGGAEIMPGRPPTKAMTRRLQKEA